MGFDWKDLDRKDAKRFDAAVLPMGLVFLVAGVAGLVTFFAFGRPSTPAGGVVFLLLGAAMLAQGLRLRRRHHR